MVIIGACGEDGGKEEISVALPPCCYEPGNALKNTVYFFKNAIQSGKQCRVESVPHPLFFLATLPV